MQPNKAEEIGRGRYKEQGKICDVIIPRRPGAKGGVGLFWFKTKNLLHKYGAVALFVQLVDGTENGVVLTIHFRINTEYKFNFLSIM